VSSQGTIDELTKDQQRYEIEVVTNGDARALLENAIAPLRPSGTQRLITGEP
jgi:hypothetical protein